MAKLIYSAITSLDGYVEDPDGKFEWAAPDEEVHAFVNDLERPIARSACEADLSSRSAPGLNSRSTRVLALDAA